jgi:catechol 2,3-dioxygenase-like lactoylglutathione lyase family enzyme
MHRKITIMHFTDAMDLFYFSRVSKTPAMSIAKPVLRILDYRKALDFYTGWLGFTVDWEYRFAEGFPVYLQVSLNGLSLHLTEHQNDCSPGGKVHIDDFPDLRIFHEQLPGDFDKPEIGPAFWDEGITAMEIADPFGNRLVFTENTPFAS